jgi:DNA-binding PadR family transcriptional regulator
MKHVVLGLLSAGPAHGYDVWRRYDQLFAGAGVEINVGQVYITLTRLERDALVTSTTQPAGRRRDRKVYQLTELGVKALREWFATPPDIPLVKPDVLLRLITAKLATSAVPGIDTRAIINQHRQRCLEALRELDRQAGQTAAGSVGGLLVHATGLHLQAELRWLELCEQHHTRMLSEAENGRG